jgi:hypothetical protein
VVAASDVHRGAGEEGRWNLKEVVSLEEICGGAGWNGRLNVQVVAADADAAMGSLSP